MTTYTTEYGELTAQHTADDLRKKEILPVTFHEGGIPKSLPLEEQTSIPTRVGEIPAELVSFHENGVVNRIFPLNGKLSGYWGEADELALAKPVAIKTPVGTMTARFISISFYDDESLRSVTLCPGETVNVKTPVGTIETRIGVAFTRNGVLRSLEPAEPTPVSTPAGEIVAFDSDAVGVNGDVNSLIFDEDGTVLGVTTTLTRINAMDAEGRTQTFVPEYRESLCGDSEQEIVPMLVEFEVDAVRIRMNPEAVATVIPNAGHTFSTKPYLPQLANTMGALRCGI